MKKILALTLALTMTFALCGCGHDNARDLNAEQEALQKQQDDSAQTSENTLDKNGKPIISATSEDVELWVATDKTGVKYVVNAYGNYAEDYSLDEEGNICDKTGKCFVASENVADFQFLSDMHFDKDTYSVTLSAKEEPVDGNSNRTRVNQYPVSCVLTLDLEPISGATNDIIILRSTDPAVANIQVNTNKKILADGDFELANGEIAIKPTELAQNGESEKNTVSIVVTAYSSGKATILAEALAGDAKTQCAITVAEGKVDFSEIPETPDDEYVEANSDLTSHHVHDYTATVVEPTPWSGGYTEYRCSCGYSYQDNFTAPLPEPEPEVTPHVHQYVSSVVAPTETEEGYTLHACECGDSYKDSWIPAIGK